MMIMVTCINLLMHVSKDVNELLVPKLYPLEKRINMNLDRKTLEQIISSKSRGNLVNKR
jgi:hypothetical protein